MKCVFEPASQMWQMVLGDHVTLEVFGQIAEIDMFVLGVFCPSLFFLFWGNRLMIGGIVL